MEGSGYGGIMKQKDIDGRIVNNLKGCKVHYLRRNEKFRSEKARL